MNRIHQPNLFTAPASCSSEPELALNPEVLRAWQTRVLLHQQQQYQQQQECQPSQYQLFELEIVPARNPVPNPLLLPAQHLHFWRWPQPPQRGAALYFVYDHSLGEANDLLLYLGETGCADRRWKGEHDCKAYLAAYGEGLVRCGQKAQLSIRFWCDAPSSTRARRQVEQEQIRLWQPPFNKECRQRWQTPFQNS